MVNSKNIKIDFANMLIIISKMERFCTMSHQYIIPLWQYHHMLKVDHMINQSFYSTYIWNLGKTNPIETSNKKMWCSIQKPIGSHFSYKLWHAFWMTIFFVRKRRFLEWPKKLLNNLLQAWWQIIILQLS